MLNILFVNKCVFKIKIFDSIKMKNKKNMIAVNLAKFVM